MVNIKAHPASLKDETDDQKDKLSFAWQGGEGERARNVSDDVSSLRKIGKRPKKTSKMTQRRGLSYTMRKQNSSEYTCSVSGPSAESFQNRGKDIANSFGSFKNTKQIEKANEESRETKSYNQGPSNEENGPIFVHHDVKQFGSNRNGQENKKLTLSVKRCAVQYAKFGKEIHLTDDGSDGEKPHSILTGIKTRNCLHSSSTKMSTVENPEENTKRCLYADRSNGAHGNDKDPRGSLSKDTSTTINKKQIKDEQEENIENKYILLCHKPISNKQEITRLITEELTLITLPQLQQLSTTNMHIILGKSSTKELFVITVNEVTVKLTLRNHKCQVCYSTEEASNVKQCQCEEVLSALENVLQEKNIQFSTLKAFHGKSFLKHLRNFTSIDYHYVNKTESLELKLDETMFQFLSSCVIPSDTDVEGYVNSVDVKTVSWSSSRIAELLQTYNNTRRELSKLEEFLSREQENHNNKHSGNSKDLQDQQAELIEISNSSDADIIDQEYNECTSGSKFDDQTEISRSRLLGVIATSLKRKEWVIVRKEVSNVLSRRDHTELDELQNGVDIFNYLQRKEKLDDEAKLDYVRNLLFILGRVDLAHVIDCFKQGDYNSLLSVSKLVESRASGAVRKRETHRGMDVANSTNCTTESDGSLFNVRQQNADNHLHGDSRSPLEHIEVFPNSANSDHNSEHCEDLEVSCEHYERFCTVQFGCCPEFWACHRCHNAESKCGKEKLSSYDVELIKCNRCDKIQEFPKKRPHCIQCNLKFSEYFCSICKHLTGTHNNPHHCKDCGICRVNADKSFHCEICGYCMDVCLKGKHKCRPNSAHDKCFICLEDGFSGCQILPCSHKVHKECAQTMLRKGITRCPVCRESFAHVLNRRPVRK